MVNVVLATDELTILGGPSQVSVDLDFGPKGDRGSLILYGLGQPSVTALPETPRIYDTYINLLESDPEYLYMYQYIAGDGGTPSWARRFKLIPNTYAENLSRTFTAGEIQINIPVSAIIAAASGNTGELIGSYESENFNVQCTVLNDNPVSLSVTVADIETFESLLSLPITIKAIEYSEGDWSDLVGQKMVHLSITVV